ncbi:phage tail protein, partial [Salmonella enterica subsp. enterica serovar Anatum]|nr:phage tail protein [Salmonella enterica subsp. enterica serovar Anatum]
MGLKSLSELGSSVMEQIYLCAINRYPNEACGFLVRTNGDKYRFIETRNVSDNPQNTFVMHVDDIIAAEDA